MNLAVVGKVSILAAATILGAAACGSDTAPAPTVTVTAPRSEAPHQTTGVAAVSTSVVRRSSAASTGTSAPPAGAPRAGVESYVGYWQGHGRQLTLDANGAGTASLFDGAVNGDKWTVSWRTVPAGITVTLSSRTEQFGNGSGSVAGRTWTGAIQHDGTATVLHFVRAGEDLANEEDGFFWCNSKRYGTSHLCGA